MRKSLIIVALISMALLFTPAHAAESVKPSDGFISITLEGVELVDVLTLISRITGTNIQYNPRDISEIKGVYVNLVDEPWRPALQSLLAKYSLVLLAEPERRNSYSIVKADKPETAVRIQYAAAVGTVVDAVLADIKSNNVSAAIARLQDFADNNRQTIKAFGTSQKTSQNTSDRRMAADVPPLPGMAQ